MNRFRISLIPVVFSLFLTACTFDGFRHPVVLKFSWFSYLNGDDMRDRCVSGAPDEFRFVYNGIYTEQVRMYDVFPDPAEAGQYLVEARVSGDGDVRSVLRELSRPNLFAPWRRVDSKVNIRAKDVEKLKLSLRSDGYFSGRAYQGDLSSIQFYWLVLGCFGGEFHVKSFLWPGSSLLDLDFAKLLSSWDFTEITVNPPLETTLFEIYGTNDEEDHHNHFFIKVRNNRVN